MSIVRYAASVGIGIVFALLVFSIVSALFKAPSYDDCYNYNCYSSYYECGPNSTDPSCSAYSQCLQESQDCYNRMGEIQGAYMQNQMLSLFIAGFLATILSAFYVKHEIIGQGLIFGGFLLALAAVLIISTSTYSDNYLNIGLPLIFLALLVFLAYKKFDLLKETPKANSRRK